MGDQVDDFAHQGSQSEWEKACCRCLKTGCHHLCSYDPRIIWHNSSLCEGSSDVALSESAGMCLGVDCHEIELCYSMSLCFKSISFIAPSVLQDTEDDNIKPLIDMGRMRGITQHNNIVVACILQKPECVM